MSKASEAPPSRSRRAQFIDLIPQFILALAALGAALVFAALLELLALLLRLFITLPEGVEAVGLVALSVGVCGWMAAISPATARPGWVWATLFAVALLALVCEKLGGAAP